MSLSERLLTPNIELSIGVPDWFDSSAVSAFLEERPIVIKTSGSGTIGYRMPDGSRNASCFVSIADGNSYPDWILNAIEDAGLHAKRSGANRFEAWVPGWNSHIITHFEQLNFNFDGILHNVIFAWNRHWNVHVFSKLLHQSSIK